MDELTREFVAETRETLERVGAALIGWEADPGEAARLDEIFRFVHTVKGSCGFLDLPRIGALAHAAETVLAGVRDGVRATDAALADKILRIIDRIAELVDALDSGAPVSDPATDAALIACLDTVDGPAPAASPGPRQARSVRVAVDLLETAMTQVSDLVLARNELGRHLRARDDGDVALVAAFERVSGAVGDVRETIARTRMQPIERLFAQLPRLVRDTASALGKSVVLRIEGSDVEIDREMVEAIRDPLTHIVRNAIDHGIESQAERQRMDKADAGILTVTAHQSGNQVSITVSDDGRGIDTDRLIDKAVAAGIVTSAKAAGLSAEVALQFVFAPGLSTAETVSDISGRGVGMDVVRANVERLGGAILLDNRPGRGLAITLRAPLTLSIMNALLIEAGGQSFALPRAAIDELVSVKSQAVRIEPVGGGQVAVVRGRMLSVVSLAAVLGLRSSTVSHLVIIDPPGGNRFALAVEHVRDHEELVVRPIAPCLTAPGVFAGQTLPENGVPVLVLDAAGIAARAGLDSERASGHGQPVTAADITNMDSMLLFEGLDGARRAVRARQVDRITEVAVAAFAGRASRTYVDLQGELIPVVLDGALPGDGCVAMLQLSHDGQIYGYPVACVHDLAPLPAIAPVGDGMVEGFVLSEGCAIALLAWPRTRVAPVRRRERA